MMLIVYSAPSSLERFRTGLRKVLLYAGQSGGSCNLFGVGGLDQNRNTGTGVEEKDSIIKSIGILGKQAPFLVVYIIIGK